MENTSSERIQSCYRSYLVRRRLHEVWRDILEQQLAEIKKLPDGHDSLVKKLTSAVGRAAAMFQGGGLKKDGGDKILVRWKLDFPFPPKKSLALFKKLLSHFRPTSVRFR